MIKVTAIIKEKEGSTTISTKKISDKGVLLKPLIVGLCRTDLFVSQGKIEIENDIVLGHEFCAQVISDPENKFIENQLVVINPLYNKDNNYQFMGLDFDGALSKTLYVPASQIYAVENNYSHLDKRIFAYTEPIAASAAVLDANIHSDQVGAIYGDNRISQLTAIILRSKGFHVDILDEKQNYEGLNGYYDYIIETVINQENFEKIMNLLKTKGQLIIKSRNLNKISMIPKVMVAKELKINAVNYYDFQKSLNWIYENYQKIEFLLGDTFDFEDFDQAFEKALVDENKKIFIKVN